MRFSSLNWVRRLFRPKAQPLRRPRHRRFPPWLEVLEDRLTPNAYTVNVLGDTSGSNSGQGTGALSGDLRYCINKAITDGQTDTITFDPTVFNSAQTITLDTALSTDPGSANVYGPTAFVISGSAAITLIGSSAGVTLDGSSVERLFAITSGATLKLQNLTLQDGKAQGGNGGDAVTGGGGGGGAGLGGAVFDDGGSFTAQGCTFLANSAQGGQGGAATGSSRVSGGGGGGGGLGASAAGQAAQGTSGGIGSGTGGAGGASHQAGQAGGFGGGGGGAGDGFGAGPVPGAGGFSGGGGGGPFPSSGGFGGGGGGSRGSAGGGGGGGGGLGGGIFSNGGTLTLTNDTFTGNTATGGAAGTQASGIIGGSGPTPNTAGQGLGGAVFAVNGTLTATDVTFSLNTAAQGGTDVYLLSDKNDSGVKGTGTVTATLTNDILGQSGTSPVSDFFANATSGGSTPSLSGSDNLISNNPASGGFTGGTISATDPQLASLASNGGPTQTMALLPGSPAIDAGDPSQAGVPDQRGIVRTGGVNIGAYQASASAFVVEAPTSVPAGTPFAFSVTAVDAFGQVAVGYRGTVHFSSSDPQASLPADTSLTSGSGSFSAILQTPGSQSLTATDTANLSLTGSQVSIAVGTPNQRFVARLYEDLLGRAAGPAELAFWVGPMDQGLLNTYQVAWFLENTPEHHVLEVQQLYERLLRREPDPFGLVYWVNFLNQGGSEQALEAQLLGSAEYFSRIGGGTALGFLEALYGDVLGRPLDPVGAQVWGQELAQGVSPAAVAAAVLSSPEADADETEALYVQYLRRPADPGGLLLFTEALLQGMSREVATMLLLGSPEYYQDAQ